jgi:hypothetical protein
MVDSGIVFVDQTWIGNDPYLLLVSFLRCTESLLVNFVRFDDIVKITIYLLLVHAGT